MIKIYDTKTRTKREFVPVNEGKVGMYVCGPTVYNYIHIGNARTFISFDTIRRYLTWRGFEVTFVQNVTDVDDKIINKALEEGRTAAEVAEEYTDAFIADMHAAGVQDPDIRPKATEEIDTMIKLVQRLIDKGHAYEVDGDVYFAVRSYSAYGELSNRNVDEMESGHRELRADGQGLEDRKRDPPDFALWKTAKPAGLLRGAKAALVGTSNAQPCPRSISICLSTSMAAARICASRTTRMSARSLKRPSTPPLRTTGCMEACSRSTPRR